MIHGPVASDSPRSLLEIQTVIPLRLLNQNLLLKKLHRWLIRTLKFGLELLLGNGSYFVCTLKTSGEFWKKILLPRATISRVSHSTGLDGAQAWRCVEYSGSGQWFGMATGVF